MSYADWKKQVWDGIIPPQDSIYDKRMKVYGLGSGQFLINRYWVGGSVIVLPNRFYLWNVRSPEEIKPHTLELFNFLKPRPDYLIIGTGGSPYQFHPAFKKHFESLGIKVDVLESFKAISTFNSCVDDDYNVACALVPPNV